ncbi:MAG TPA: hypothetical protein VGI22_09860 [Xanthobacteraceae bacterium]
MTISQDHAQQEAAIAASARATLVVCALTIAGFALTILLLYPGYLTNDATYVYSYIPEWRLGDWQSPLMTMLWWLIDPIAPGPGSMFLLFATLYWLGFGVIALAVARRSAALAFLVPLLGLTPPAFMLLSMIWRDILFSAIWLFAAAIVYAVAERTGPLRWTAQILALLLICFGILLRPNSIAAAPLLIGFALWPTRFEWKRTALLFVPALVAGYGLIHLVYYEILHVKRENPLHSLLVFDLGGITHFAKENQFPVSWSTEETALLTSRCYEPQHWDSYWTLDPCKFVMARLERPDDVIFGTERLVDAWKHAVATHPFAYLAHRLTFTWTFLALPNLTLEIYKLVLPDETPLAHNPYFMALMPLHDALKSTLLYRTGLWLLLAVAEVGWAWRARRTRSGAFAIGVAGAGILYIMSFSVLGVATDFRYAYWGVVATLAALVPALLARRDMRAMPSAAPDKGMGS